MNLVDFFTLCVTLCVLALVGAITFHHHNESKLKSLNIESAIEKGIDPLSVRCSYASANDTICIVFASKDTGVVLQSSK
jgi:hypothetical protein